MLLKTSEILNPDEVLKKAETNSFSKDKPEDKFEQIHFWFGKDLQDMLTLMRNFFELKHQYVCYIVFHFIYAVLPSKQQILLRYESHSKNVFSTLLTFSP